MPVETLSQQFHPSMGAPTKELYSMAGLVFLTDFFDWSGDQAIETPMRQIIGSGGVHRVYRRPADDLYIPNRQKTWKDGTQFNVDLRADGGYIMCPGSIHPRAGKLYEEVMPWTLELLMHCPVYDPFWLPHRFDPHAEIPLVGDPILQHLRGKGRCGLGGAVVNRDSGNY